ncbi:hypothetical protein PR202_gn00912 [Eleusine coracana subsp. coracana]|uniref:Calmodulin-binding protein n=1 Tax=Eleusine coracana subsp. coracana TaxID=191504 RepID=A0AAV5G7Q6_ELECO|nr:hypothetical protein PR202_gn00912 [Eleusine coracana subsp. coracana]
MQRQGRHLERSGSKRALNHSGAGGDDDDERAPKRPRVPALAREWTKNRVRLRKVGADRRLFPDNYSVIVEALKVDSLQKLCSSLEPILRRVVFADTLVKQAYDDWISVVEYDGKALLRFKQKTTSVTTRSEAAKAATSYPVSYGSAHSQSQKQLIGEPVNAEQSSPGNMREGGTRVTAIGNQVAKGYATNSQDIAPSMTMQYDMSSITPETQFNGSSILTQASRSSSSLALRPSQQHQNFEFPGLGQSMQPSGLNPFDDWSRLQENRGGVDDYLMEEIRARSHEILENDEMQQMLRILSNGGPSTSFNNLDGFPSYMQTPAPAFNFEDDRTRPSGRAVVGWLKIKAAMRWGIFVRRKAAERRAQLVELED